MMTPYHIIQMGWTDFQAFAFFLLGGCVGLIAGILLSNTVYEDYKLLKRWLSNRNPGV